MFNQRKNKRFSYKSSLQDSKNIESKDDLKAKWNESKGDAKRKVNVFRSLVALMIALVSLFVLLYILEGYMK